MILRGLAVHLSRCEEQARKAGMSMHTRRLIMTLRDVDRFHEFEQLTKEQVRVYAEAWLALETEWSQGVTSKRLKQIRTFLMDHGLSWVPGRKA